MLKRKRLSIKKATAAFCMAGLCLPTMLFVMLYHGYLVRRYVITTNRIAKGSSIKVVLLADLHSEPSVKRQQTIVKLVKEQQPDLILYAGDIVDDLRAIDGAQRFLEQMQGIAPAYYAMGNHECYTENPPKILKWMQKYGVHPLVNEWVFDKSGIVIAGAADAACYSGYTAWESAIQKAFDPMCTQENFRILISHRPDPDYANLPVDLVVSGHAHGGQVRIPGLLNGLYAPNQGIFPKYAGGLYERAGHLHLVSRGLAVFPMLPRVFNPPEVVVIEIHGK